MREDKIKDRSTGISLEEEDEYLLSLELKQKMSEHRNCELEGHLACSAGRVCDSQSWGHELKSNVGQRACFLTY